MNTNLKSTAMIVLAFCAACSVSVLITASLVLVGTKASADDPAELYGRTIPADKKLKVAWVESLTERGHALDRDINDCKKSDTLKYTSMPVGEIARPTAYISGDGRPPAKVKAVYSDANGIGPQKGVMRRDPSDIIKVGDLYYLWFTKGAQSSGYDASVWYATSSDGHAWTEKSEALPRGPVGSWDEQSVFTPNILVADGRYWLFYTAVPKPFVNKGPDTTKTALGIAVSDSPNGPWEKLTSNPVLQVSDNHDDFDSLRVDDACLIVRGGKYWLYYKGRQWNKSPGETKMGVAIADKPDGPYVKHSGNPIIQGNHEVLVWPQGKGVAAMIGTTGPKSITSSILYAEDGLHFFKTHNIINVPTAAGAYRGEAFTDSGMGKQIHWGVHIGKRKGFLPFVERFDLLETGSSDTSRTQRAQAPHDGTSNANPAPPR